MSVYSQHYPWSFSCLHKGQLGHLPWGNFRVAQPLKCIPRPSFPGLNGQLEQILLFCSPFIRRPGICPHTFPHPCQVCSLPCRGSHLEGPHHFTTDSSAMQEGDQVTRNCEGINMGKLCIYTDTLILARYALLQGISSMGPAKVLTEE